MWSFSAAMTKRGKERRTDDSNTYQALFSCPAGTGVLRELAAGVTTTFVTEHGFTPGPRGVQDLHGRRVRTTRSVCERLLGCVVDGRVVANPDRQQMGTRLQNDSTLAVDDLVLYDS